MRISDWSSDVALPILNAVSYMAGNYASGRLATRIGPDRMILTGSIVAAGGAGLLTALVLGTDMIPLLLFGPVMFVGVANGLSLPSAIASAISLRPELAGTASGLVGFLQMMVGALATLLVRSEEHTFELQSLMRSSYSV